MGNNELFYCSRILSGTERAELVLRNARLVNVVSDEVKKSDIAISNGKIVGVGDYFRGKNEINLMGKFICPGFINAYANVKDIVPYDKDAVLAGTTSYVLDLSNANDVGKYLENTQNIIGNAFFLLPISFVLDKKSDDIQKNVNVIGFTVYPNDIEKLLNDSDVLLKLSKLNDKSIYVCMDDFSEDIIKIMSMFKNVVIKGCRVFSELLECVRLGCSVLIDDKYSKELITGVIRNYLPQNNLLLCTEEFTKYSTKNAVKSGLNPVYATKMTTYNIANKLGLSYLGAVTPGRQADLVVLNDLTSVDIDTVFVKGKQIK